jgi:predicted DNA-binding protein (MmcQ/YjbR family)
MDIEAFRDYCLRKDHVTESFPFNENTLVFKVANKMFALTDIETFEYVNLKSNAEKALQLREEHEGVKPGYHMNKKLWNSVYTSMDISDELFYQLIDESYIEVISSFTKKKRSELSL